MYGSEPDIQGVKLMQCYGEYSIPKTQFICEVALAGNQTRDLRIICYDDIGVQNRDYCESKYFSESYFGSEENDEDTKK
jgi:hypothetical protein